MANLEQESRPPDVLANVTPDLGGAGQTRLIVEAVKETVADLKSDVKELKSHRFTDLLWHVTALAATFILLGGMMVAAYFKIEDRLLDLTRASARVDTKLEDLLQRIPPAPTPIPRR